MGQADGDGSMTPLPTIVQRAADNARGYTAYHVGALSRREFPRRTNPWPTWSIERREWANGWADEDRALDTQRWARVCPVFRHLVP